MTLAFVPNLFGTSYSGIRWKPVHFPGVAGREMRLGGVVEPAVLIPPGGKCPDFVANRLTSRCGDGGVLH